MTEWIERKIADLGMVVGGATPSTKDAQNYINGSIPWITPKDLAGFHGRYIGQGERNITEKGLASCSTQMMPKNSVLFTSRAPIGYIAISANPVCTNQGFKSIVPNENTDYLFLYYLLKFNKDRIESLGSGTTFKEVSGTTMKNIVVTVPKEKETQREIAAILSSLDDKIEENGKINHNLQQQFQALFDSWFKRFEPFSQPKYESELGLIPEGWSVKDIYSISSIIYGAPFSSKLFNDEHKGSPIVRIRDLKTQNTSTYTTEIHPKGYLIQNGDIIVGMDGEFRPYIWGSGEAWLNQRVCVFENKRPKGKVFLFCSIKPLLNLIEQTEVATTVIHIGKQDFDAFRIVMPPIEILNAFDDITDMCKTFVLVVGNNTTSVRSGACAYCSSYNSGVYVPSCRRGYSIDNRSYIEFECDKAVEAGIKIVVLYNSSRVDRYKCPEAVRFKGKHVAMHNNGYWDYQAVKNAIMY